MHKPFAVLEDLVRDGRIKFATITPPAPPAATPAPADAPVVPAVTNVQRDSPVPVFPAGMADEDLFGHAMQDVRALGWSDVPLHRRPPLEIQPQNDENDALRVLEEFLKSGDVEIEQTPEYIEAAVQPRGRLYLQDLRSGRFSVQAWLDLHGMNRQEARFALDEFVLASVRASLSCVQVIHGRGRHSHKQQPILKDAIQRWLCSRRLGRYVLAYTSARLCDGGGGAVYILLRS